MTKTSVSKKRKAVASLLHVKTIMFPALFKIWLALRVPAKSQSRGAEQSRVVPAFGRHDSYLRRRQRKRMFNDLMTHVPRKQFPSVRDATANHDRLRVQNIN